MKKKITTYTNHSPAMFEFVLSSYGRAPVYIEKTHLLD